MLNITGSDSNSSVVGVESFDAEYDNQPGKYVVLQARNLAERPARACSRIERTRLEEYSSYSFQPAP